jgi:hypothetical protein
MKVFKYDVSRSAKGDLIEDIARPHSNGATVHTVNLPRHNTATHSWRATNDAGYNDSRPNLSYPFPVCFCMGQFRCGTEDPIWEWVILMPRKIAPVGDSACQILRDQFPHAVRMLECIEGDSLEDINPADVQNLLDQCLANPAKIEGAVSEFFARESRLDFDMGR